MAEAPKRCKQCGILKEPVEFRLYTYSKVKKTTGRYGRCKSCEAINARYSRARDAGDIDELLKINMLYETLDKLGLQTPISSKDTVVQSKDDDIDKILQFYMAKGNVTTAHHGESIVKPVLTPTTVPAELSHWLEVDFQEWLTSDISPEYLQETIYTSLKAKYRPQLGIDKEKFIPIYDDTYKDILLQILRRFDEYEDMLSNEEEE